MNGIDSCGPKEHINICDYMNRPSCLSSTDQKFYIATEHDNSTNGIEALINFIKNAAHQNGEEVSFEMFDHIDYDPDFVLRVMCNSMNEGCGFQFPIYYNSLGFYLKSGVGCYFHQCKVILGNNCIKHCGINKEKITNNEGFDENKGDFGLPESINPKTNIKLKNNGNAGK